MKVSKKVLALVGLVSISAFAGTYTEDLSVEHADLTTSDGAGRWVPDADAALSSPGTTEIVDEDGAASYYPKCNTVGTDCNPIKNGYIYGKIAIKGYIPGTTGWGQWAGAGLILDPTLTTYVEPGASSGISPIGLGSTSVITVDMDAALTGGNTKSGNTNIKFRLGEASYFCPNDGSCMVKRLPAQAGRATYTLNVKDFKKNNWIYTDADMKTKGRNVDNYKDVYRFEIRHDAEPQTAATDACTASSATFKIYKVTMTNVSPTGPVLNSVNLNTLGMSLVGRTLQFSNVSANTEIVIMNAQGEVVHTATVNAANNTVDMSKAQQGVYFVKSTSNGVVSSQKVTLM